MKSFSLIVHALSDWWLQYKPKFLVARNSEYAYAFLVHPRDGKDIYRKYPFLKALPQVVLEWFSHNFWPVVVSEITGLTSVAEKKPIPGYVITIAMTAEQMVHNRSLAVKRIVQALRLAERKGARIVGLGALTASVTRGGLDLVDAIPSIGITTGHAYTAHNVTQYVRELQTRFNLPRGAVRVAIVGAAGSVGSTCAQILARDGFNHLTLIDLARKHERFAELPDRLRELNTSVDVEVSADVSRVYEADFIITATNAPEAVVNSEHVREGTVIVDDAQPSDIAPGVFDRADVIVLEAGAVATPGITTNFNMGLHSRYDNFCCMAELLILASQYWDKHYVVNRATLESVDEMSKFGSRLGFTIAALQNERELISAERLETVGAIMKARYADVPTPGRH